MVARLANLVGLLVLMALFGAICPVAQAEDPCDQIPQTWGNDDPHNASAVFVGLTIDGALTAVRDHQNLTIKGSSGITVNAKEGNDGKPMDCTVKGVTYCIEIFGAEPPAGGMVTTHDNPTAPGAVPKGSTEFFEWMVFLVSDCPDLTVTQIQKEDVKVDNKPIKGNNPVWKVDKSKIMGFNAPGRGGNGQGGIDQDSPGVFYPPGAKQPPNGSTQVYVEKVEFETFLYCDDDLIAVVEWSYTLTITISVSADGNTVTRTAKSERPPAKIVCGGSEQAKGDLGNLNAAGHH